MHRTASARLALAFAFVVAPGCGGAPPAAPEPALRVDVPDGVTTWGFAPVPGETVLLGMPPLQVARPVTLRSLSIEAERGSFDLLAARVSMFACRTCPERPGLLGYRGYAGSSCSVGPWPPKGYGPSYPLEGFTLGAGDRPSLVLYLRPGPPPAMSGPIALRYDDGGEARELRITNERISVEPEGADGPDACADSIWFGGTKDPAGKHVQPLSPAATP